MIGETPKRSASELWMFAIRTLRKVAQLEHRLRAKMLSALLVRNGKLTRPAFVLSQSIRNDILFQHHVSKWFEDKGDSTLRLTYPELNESSIVLDLGGYQGQFAADIFSRYGCRIYVFEPSSAFYRVLRNRFTGNDRI